MTLFLALLEMIRMGRVLVSQQGVYDQIVLEAGEPSAAPQLNYQEE